MPKSIIDEIFDGIGERIQGTRLIDWIGGVEKSSPGIELKSPDVIKLDPVCKCFDIDGELCFHSSIIGGLSDRQKSLYCKEKKFEESLELRERVSKFREIAGACSKEVREKHPKGERLEPYLACMSKMGEEKGIKF